MTRVFKFVLLGVLGGVVAVGLALGVLVGTESGSRWALARVPGLQVADFQGRLAGSWQASQLSWVEGGNRVEVQAPLLTWSPGCLLRATLCIDQLQAQRIDMAFAPSDAPAESGPLQLPALRLPVAIELGEVKIGQLRLDGSDLLGDVQLAAHWTQTGMRIDRLHLQRDDLRLDLQGDLQPEGDWPLQLQGQVQLPSVEGKSWQLALTAQGELQKILTLEGTSSGYLDARLNGELQALAEHLPATLQIRSDAFKPTGSLPDTLQFNQLELNAKGDLLKGYKLSGSASLPAEQSPIALVLSGRVDSKGAKVDALDLNASDNQRLKLQASADWQQGLTADAQLDWLDFPWLRLYPLETPPDVTLKQFNAQVHYRDGNYQGTFKGDLDGPAGAFSLASPFEGDLNQVKLPQLALSAGQGKAEGSVAVRFADTLAWDVDLQLSALDPAYWLAELPGTLAGPLRSKGEMKGDALKLDAQLDLKGRLRGQPAVLKVEAQGAGESWTLGALAIQLGDNRINGSGSLQQRLAGRVDLDLPRLGQLWPRLQGQVKGRLDVAGTLKAPQGTLTLQGQQLAQAENRIQRLDLDARLDSAQRGVIDLKAGGIHLGDTALGTLQANGKGDIRQQALTLALDGPQLKLDLGLDGQLSKGDWRGRLASGRIQAGGQDWQLQAPARLQRLASGQLDFGAHCWRSGQASLCGDDQRLAPEPRLRYHLKQFPLDSLAQWLPKDFAWQGLLNADVNLDIPASGPKGNIVVDASGGTLRVRDKGRWIDFPYQALRLDSTLAPRRIDTRLNFRGERLGELSLNARLDPLGKNKPLSGDFRLAGLDLSVARPFVPMVERLAGQLNGSGNLSGTLLAPQVNGNLVLSQGEVSGAELPVSLQDLSLQATIAGEQVQLNGGWRSGEAGRGQLSGNLTWGQALGMDLRLQGQQLPVTVEPYATLEVAPDLNLRLVDDKLAITGKVQVPKGKITVRELPPSTVKVSDDTVIVGHQTEEGKPPMAMAMDIDVDVGREKLSFKGFGLTANLLGHVHIGDNLDTRGELSLADGRYRAYGQRLTIRRARLLFAGPLDQPYLDIEAIRKVDDVIAGIRLSGSAEQPTTQVFSEPAMSQEQALSYLVLGRPLGTSGEDNNMLAEAALGLGLAGSAGITGSLASSLGIDDFQLDTEGSGNTTSVVASGNLTEKLSLRYGVGVFEPANTIALRYKLSRMVYLEAASGLASSLDIFYKRDF
ncbi:MULTISPECIES: translocation/assembly module TamB domain-containing protein [unclassified Pseudomonas]|uniref:translocation/assembly module TamB domain-containing protein n=1 Tax=unclassified Pseudomonas TaxID=196821 RepID=UPI000A0B3183|nr:MULTISPECIES: translocation/assembly module TamB domain-containing protein [unclassified Pseudomonas]SMF37552.1 translocation and assembly module TamB [Pseudomonas sp. LAIL14HWK12:I11]SMR78911.1 translocation and assembly module TamB [Pseudomonas sp. LAIL14HWK12:I10]SOD04669.1 translocation and assembly module TamB [Pseudomonas sp. LAIL14HWK12:I8]